MKINFSFLFGVVCIFVAGHNLHAASATWNGTADSTWTNMANWSASPVPGINDTATFNNGGNANTTLSLVAGVQIQNIIFDTANAAAYTIGSGAAGSQTLTMSGSGEFTVNSTVVSNELFNANLSLSTASGARTLAFTNNSIAAGQSLTFAGGMTAGAAGTKTVSIAGNGKIIISSGMSDGLGQLALTKSGAGTLIVSGTAGFSGNVAVNGGTFTLTGTNSTPGNLTVAQGVLNVSSNGMVFPRIGTTSQILIGTVAGQGAAIYQNGSGTIVSNSNTGGGEFDIGAAAGAYGYYNLSSGVVDVAGEIDPGGANGGAGTFGQFDMTGGTVNLPNRNAGCYFLPNRNMGGNESSVVNILGGTVQIAGGGISVVDGNFNGLTINWSSTTTAPDTNATTISGTGQFLTPTIRVKLNEGANFTGITGVPQNLCALNLNNGGVLQTLGFLNGATANNTGTVINFNGGILRAGSAGNAAFLAGLGGVYFYSGGGTIDDNGQAITIAQPLLVPTGNGVVSIPVTSAGSNYIVPPQVSITDSTGTGASAYATINPTNGALTGIVVTSPGNNYTSPTATLNGGGTSASLGAVAIAANVGGGLTKAGVGTLTLSGANSFVGGTTVGAGTLALGVGGSLASTNLNVAGGATLDVSGISFALGGNQSLSGSGTVTGSVSTVSGSKVYAGTDGTYGTNTFNNNLTFVSGAAAYFDLSSSFSGANDRIILNGTSSVLACGGAGIGIKCGATLDQTNDYTLFTLSGGSASVAGSFNPTPAWTGTTPAKATNYFIVTIGNNVVLHYNSGVTNLPTVTNLAATAVTAVAATLNGQVLATGGQFPTVKMYYGKTDGGTNPAAWTTNLSLGLQGGSFATAISNLTGNTTYYFTALASNAAGTVWAAPSQSLTTPLPNVAVVTNLAATGAQGGSAILNGQVVSVGSQTPGVTLYYGPSNGGTNVGNWANSIYIGQQGGSYSYTISGLATNTTYYYAAAAGNPDGTAWAQPAQIFTTLPTASVVSVLTFQYNNARNGINTNETLLTPATMNTNSFGRLATYATDGYVYAQPLYVPSLTIPGQGTHNVVYVATEQNSVYAFDADGNVGVNGGLLWHTNLGVYILSNNTEFGNRYDPGGPYGDILPDVGITGTPVIDSVTGTLYVDVATREVVAGVSTNYYHRIHALNLTNGMEQSYSPVIVTASVPGVGTDSSGGVMTFNAKQSNERSALTLAGGILYVAYAGYGDTDPYHGWVIGYNPTNLVQMTNYVFNSTPNATTKAFGAHAAEGGIWMSGDGLCVDANTNLYFETGNGSFSANTNGGDYSDSFIKLSTTNKLTLADYFTPYNQAALSSSDLDLASAGAMLLPDEVGSTNHPHLIVGGSKGGEVYLLDRDNLGQYNASGDSQIVQEFAAVSGSAQIYCTPVCFNYKLYYQYRSGIIKAYTITNSAINTNATSQTATTFSGYGDSPVISASGNSNAILWAIQSDAFATPGPTILHAYNATNLALELYNSSQLIRDKAPNAVKMTTPTVANGKVYVAGQLGLAIYGYTAFLATPTISPNGSAFTNSVIVTLADATPNTAIYYTLDGTVPTTGSVLYTGPFVITTTLNLEAVAVKSGAVNSGVAAASFVNTAAAGNGVGLLGQYWTNTAGAVFTNASFNTLPTLVRTDAVVGFNWSNGPDAGIGRTNYAVRWTGSVQAQYNEGYTFTTIADDGVRLWVNGQLVVNDWNAHASPATNSGSITLAAQQLYNVRLEYFQGGSNAVVQLQWGSPSTAPALVPQTQLYPYTNPPPVVMMSSPADSATNSTALASVTLVADADAAYNPVSTVSFYASGSLLGTLSNGVAGPVFHAVLTARGLNAGNYALTAVATDGSGLGSTSAPVNITVNAASGAPYGLTNNGTVNAFLNMPVTYNGTLPPLLSGTGAFGNTTNRTVAGGLIPYAPNTPLWSDAAVKSRYLAVPNNGGLITPDEQITFAPTNSWTFPAGTVFVKNFDLVVDETGTNTPLRRLETRLLVRDINGAVYGVTYKWRADNSDADLLASSLTENIVITNATGVRTQAWYYPSPADCLTCHTPVAKYVLGLSTRQLNGSLTYPATGNPDNQLRTLNRLGLFNPAINEADIPNYAKLSALTNLSASLEERSRSYLDANCAQCHQPGGAGITFDARYDTPLANQNLVNYAASVTLGLDNPCIIKAKDIWRSVLYARLNSLDPAIKMPPLARSLIDTNALQVFGDWINSLPGIPALAPPLITPAGGTFGPGVTVTLTPPEGNAQMYYTLDGSLPTTNSFLYGGPLLLTNSATLNAAAYETNYNHSIAAGALFTLQPLYITGAGFLPGGAFQLGLFGVSNHTYVLQASTNLTDWTPLSTNTATNTTFLLQDPNAPSFPNRFYRTLQQ